MKATGRALLLRVCAELGSGRITEAYILDPGHYTEGLTEGQEITINPAHATVDVVVHECLHRLFPKWSEAYVRKQTKRLRGLMDDEETLAFFGEYQRRAKKRKRAVKA